MIRVLPLEGYRDEIDLDVAVDITHNPAWAELLPDVLRAVGLSDTDVASADTTTAMVDALHGALAPLDPWTLDTDVVRRIETIAVGHAVSRGEPEDPQRLPTIADAHDTDYRAAALTSLWVGDITRLGADAIVNAANQFLHGCRLANHRCIDNAIHSAAGPRLRDDCATIIRHQGAKEYPGHAKITRGYALPAPFVIHTVGPELHPSAQPTAVDEHHLTRCYRACLDNAAQVDSIRTIAFCSISTGVFGYPKPAAARAALETVAQWLEEHPGRMDRIVFNVFSEADADHYKDAQ